MDENAKRDAMVDRQLIPRGIADTKVLNVFRKVPRHEFVPAKNEEGAYGDFPLPIGEGQTISQPYMVAVMTEHLRLEADNRVLEIGTGSGYQTAILAELAKEVYTVERIESLAKAAESNLKKRNYANVAIKVADGTMGWEENAPYDRIIVTAGAPKIPPSLVEQLKDGGRIVAPVGGEFSQMLIVAEKKNGRLIETETFACSFVPLVGKEGWGS